jgi:hypothetical protein
MKKLVVVSMLALLQTYLFAQTGNVTLSGSTWTGKVNGTTEYTGTDMGAAAQACITAMPNGGTLEVQNSGTWGGLRIYGNTTVNCNGVTVTCNSTTGKQSSIYAQNVSNDTIENMKMAGGAYYGTRFSTVQGVTWSGMSGGNDSTLRSDNCQGGNGSNVKFNSPNLSVSGTPDANACEVYGINGVTWSTVTANGYGRCGLLLDSSTGCSGSTVNGTKCGYGTGFAGFRTANNNRTTTQGTVNSTSCGRGYFSVSGAADCTISTCNANGCSGIGIWLQSTSNTHVNSGLIQNCAGGCSSISQDLGGNSISVTCGSGN